MEEKNINKPQNATLQQGIGGYPLSDAYELAFHILDTLIPYCEKIHIAGSVRREKKEVGDIEIVCQPKITVLKDMFGWDEGIIRNLDFINAIENLGEIIKGKIDGKYIQIRLPEGINLDLFMPNVNDYYRQLAIRTGSADYSRNIIARGWRKMGFVGTKDGLRKKEDCKNTGSSEKPIWKCINPNPYLPPVWESEEHFFQWIGIKYLPPNER